PRHEQTKKIATMLHTKAATISASSSHLHPTITPSKPLDGAKLCWERTVKGTETVPAPHYSSACYHRRHLIFS
ncbi:MAG TPA: hypothetical protein VGO47_00155, partial [Chlamydiales bacterium]|nr:hypothetical protein [Chlamydiales bacterium]